MTAPFDELAHEHSPQYELSKHRAVVLAGVGLRRAPARRWRRQGQFETVSAWKGPHGAPLRECGPAALNAV